MTYKMTFAPGWTQEIAPANEMCDLACYISDTHKAVYGYRPRFWDMREWSLDDLRAEAQSLLDEVMAGIEREEREAHERMLEANRHALATRRAKKPLASTYKPFANIKEIL